MYIVTPLGRHPKHDIRIVIGVSPVRTGVRVSHELKVRVDELDGSVSRGCVHSLKSASGHAVHPREGAICNLVFRIELEEQL